MSKSVAAAGVALPAFAFYESHQKDLTKNPIMFQSSLEKFAKNVKADNPRFIPVSPKDRKGADRDGKAYWIPLFSVWQKDKARIVFDAKASNGKGTCLNDKLLQGPDRNNSLRGVVVRFRCHPYAVKSDVANMFHNIRVKDPHPNYLRFFWYQDNDPSKELIEYMALVHVMGLTSSPAIANLAVRYAARETPPP